jgi:two-component system nitrate/nitrite sensor histidine kinase NarX
MQAQAIQKHVHDGKLATAEAQLARLAEATLAAHTDVRESILGLKASGGASPQLLSTLRQYLATYEASYGIATELTVADGLGDDDFAPDTTVQVLRVIAEALTNARKHARAGRVCVTVACGGGVVRITIADDGRGFDAGAPAAGAPEHYGLAFMRERMAQVGGDLAIDAHPGAGTRIILDAPLYARQEVIG